MNNLEGEKHTLRNTQTAPKQPTTRRQIHNETETHTWRERHAWRHTNSDIVRVIQRQTHTETHTLKGTHTH